MDKPTELELLGVQTQGDADIIRRDYPEWCALSPEERGVPERAERHATESRSELMLLFGFILAVLVSVTLILVFHNV